MKWRWKSPATARMFYGAVGPFVARVVVVDPNQFRVISQSVKNTLERCAQHWRCIWPRNYAGSTNEGKTSSRSGEPHADAVTGW